MKKLKKDPHTCLFCSNVYSRIGGLERHMLCHTEEKPYDCPACQMEFRRPESLADHQLNCHLNPKRQPLLCNVCGNEWTTKCSLKSHRKKLDQLETDGKDGEKQEENTVEKDCIESQLPSPNPTTQSSSSRSVISISEERFECDSCPATFGRRKYLAEHKRLNRCKGIPKETENSEKVVEIATTTAVPAPAIISNGRVTCDKCSITFSTLQNLKRHLKFKRCEKRQREAERDKQLKKAPPVLAMRRRPRPPFRKLGFEYNKRNGHGDFVCEKCNLKFNSYTSLRHHLRENGCIAGGVKCDVCQVTFTPSYLSRHKQFGHCTGSRAPVANKMKNLDVKVVISTKIYAGTQRKSGLSPVDKLEEKNVIPSKSSANPSKKPRSRCSKCSSVFISRAFLKQHYVNFHDMKLWSCKLCPDWYCRFDGLQRHMLGKHKRRLEEYRCKLCGLKLATLDMLKGHEMKHHVKKNYECDICHYTYMRADSLREHCKRTGHGTDGGNDDAEKIPKTLVKAPDQEKKRTPERKSRRVIKPVTPYSPSVSPVGARTKKASPSPDITKPKFYTVTTATAIQPKSHKKLEFKEKPKLKRKPAQQKLGKGSKSSSLLRPPVFQYQNLRKELSSSPPDDDCTMELLPSPATSPSQLQVMNLRHDIMNRFREEQQQKQSEPWDASFFLHMNRYNPES